MSNPIIYHWSRKPGTFLNELTGEVYALQPSFHGNVMQWYETLIETVNDVSRETTKNGTFFGCPACGQETNRPKNGIKYIMAPVELATILSLTSGYKQYERPDVRDKKFVSIGKLWDKYEVLIDPNPPSDSLLRLETDGGEVAFIKVHDTGNM